MEILSLHRLYLHNFRNYAELRLKLSPEPVILIGPNGAGKTNILEAISFLSPGRGLRNAKLSEIDRHAEGSVTPWALAASVRTKDEMREIGTGRVVVENDTEGNKRVVKLDGQQVKGHTELSGVLSVIWLTPQMDPLFLSAASVRRRFLDRLVYNFDSNHAKEMLSYEHARTERARLLKERSPDPAWLSILERKMAETGVAIASARHQAIDYVQHAINTAEGPFPKADLRIEGKLEQLIATTPALQLEEMFAEELKQSRKLDAASGRTNVGVHRSDLIVHHCAKNMPAESCSTGEQKALLLSIILAEARARVTWHKSVPIILLDEVVAHLDNERRCALFGEILDIGAQAWMTGTDMLLFEEIASHAQLLEVENARVRERALL